MFHFTSSPWDFRNAKSLIYGFQISTQFCPKTFEDCRAVLRLIKCSIILDQTIIITRILKRVEKEYRAFLQTLQHLVKENLLVCSVGKFPLTSGLVKENVLV